MFNDYETIIGVLKDIPLENEVQIEAMKCAIESLSAMSLLRAAYYGKTAEDNECCGNNCGCH